MVSALPSSTPVLRVEALSLLREHETGRMLGLAVVMAGLGLLGAAWLALCRQVRESDPVEALDLARYAALLWSAPLLLAPPLFSRDGWSYAGQGMLTSVGISPYEHGPIVLSGPIVQAIDPRWLATPAPYGPLPLVLGGWGADLTGNPWLLVVGHRLVALVGLVLLAWAVPRLAAWTGTNPALATAIVIASPLMLANGVGGLHNDLLMAGLMGAALVVAAERGWVWGAALGGAAAAVKLPGGLVCLGVALLAAPVGAALLVRLRHLAAVATAAVGTLLGLGLAAGLGTGWVHALGVPGTVTTPLSLPTVLGGLLDLLAGWSGQGPAPATFLDLTRTVATAVAAALLVRLALVTPTGDHAAALRSVAAAVGASLLLSPVVHLWYLLWLVPFVAPLRLPQAAQVALVGGSLVMGLVAPLDSSLHGAYHAIVFGILTCTALTAVLLLTERARSHLERIVSDPRARLRAAASAPAAASSTN